MTVMVAYAGRLGGPLFDLDLSDEDFGRLMLLRQTQKLTPFEVGGFIKVKDQSTGNEFKVAWAPCECGDHHSILAVDPTVNLSVFVPFEL